VRGGYSPFDPQSSNLDSGGLELGVDQLLVNGDPGLSGGSGTGGWNAEDMLLTNETKYGYKSTYNSDLTEYTLPVEKQNTEEYRRRELEAEKLAMEIESSASYKKNIDKELSDNEEEEEAFSAVVRAPQSHSGKKLSLFQT
jgi:PAB1-binding protein PBP1